jgi:hypothetical protein
MTTHSDLWLRTRKQRQASTIEETDVTEAEYEEATIRASHHDEERNRQTGYDPYFPDEP